MKLWLRATLIVLLAALNTWASAEDEFKNLQRIIHCEHYLTGTRAKSAEASFERQIYTRPFPFQTLHGAQASALRRIGLGPKIEKNELHRYLLSLEKMALDSPGLEAIRFRVQRFDNGTLSDVLNHGYPDTVPILWQQLWVDDDQLRLGYDVLSKFHARFNPTELEPTVRNSILGFQTDPDHEGIRKYLLVHYFLGEAVINIELGIDVPCSRYAEFRSESYLGGAWRDIVLTTAATYCRVPVATFARSEL